MNFGSCIITNHTIIGGPLIGDRIWLLQRNLPLKRQPRNPPRNRPPKLHRKLLRRRLPSPLRKKLHLLRSLLQKRSKSTDFLFVKRASFGSPVFLCEKSGDWGLVFGCCGGGVRGVFRSGGMRACWVPDKRFRVFRDDGIGGCGVWRSAGKVPLGFVIPVSWRSRDDRDLRLGGTGSRTNAVAFSGMTTWGRGISKGTWGEFTSRFQAIVCWLW